MSYFNIEFTIYLDIQMKILSLVKVAQISFYCDNNRTKRRFRRFGRIYD